MMSSVSWLSESLSFACSKAEKKLHENGMHLRENGGNQRESGGKVINGGKSRENGQNYLIDI
jgi:hypothetical protein